MIKSKAEILNIEKACNLTDKTFDYILGKIKEGISEKELAFEIEFFIKRHGSGISFPSIVAFGKNSAFPHHKSTNQQLMINDQILIDIGAKLNGYCSDMSRTVFFGKPSSEQKRMYQTVLDAQKKSIEFLNKVAPLQRCNLAKRVDKVARDYIISQGYPTIPHSLGHGIGRKVHEAPKLSPKSKHILKPGMVFTIEPGIYIPNFGGVRIEDVVVLGNNSLSFVSKSSRKLTIL